MPNPKPNTRGLRPNPHSLGVEVLEEHEVSRPVRVRASAEAHRRLAGMTAKEVGALLERALGLRD